MTERPDEYDHDPYWNDDVEIGEARTPAGLATVRLKLHIAEEQYFSRNEIVPLAPGPRQRTYIHARPYILEPEIMLTIALYPNPTDAGATGEVVSSEWEGMRHIDVGNAQAWWYPKDRLVLLWEAYLYDRYRERIRTRIARRRHCGPGSSGCFWSGLQ